MSPKQAPTRVDEIVDGIHRICTTFALEDGPDFQQAGDQPPVVTEDLGAEMCDYYRAIGIFAHEDPVREVVDRIESLDPDWIHGMHGGSLDRETLPHFTRALREEPFAYEGMLLGREVLPESSVPAAGD